MSSKSNGTVTIILSTVSFFSLLLFLVYWNILTYSKNKTNLMKEVETAMELSYSMIKEKALIKHMIFVSNDSTGFLELGTSLEMDSTHHFSADSGQENEIISIRIDVADSIIDERKFPFSVPTNLHDSLMHNEDCNIKEVKVDFFNDLLDTNLTLESMNRFDVNHFLKITNSVDKQVYVKIKERLIEAGLPSNFMVDLEDVSKESLRISYQLNSFTESIMFIYLLDYKGYLWKLSLPSLIFSGMLLSLTGITFWILWNNWRKEKKMTVMKDEFISNMTHELKTPISTVSVALEALSTFDLNQETEKSKEYIDISRIELNRLSLLVDKVLDIAALDGGAIHFRKNNLDVSKIIEKVILSLKIKTEDLKASLDFTNNADYSVMKADEDHLTNVFFNIIDNALKYSGGEKQIDIFLDNEGDWLKISFCDQGIGLTEENKKLIFNRFYRVSEKDHHNVKGHGLGLSYVKEVVEKHEGKIEVESTLGVGSKFVIWFPFVNQPAESRSWQYEK